MTPKEFEEWLNDRMDYYSNKAIEAENCLLEDDMTHYMDKFDTIVEVFHKFNEVQFKEA